MEEADEVIASDQEVNEMHIEIDDRCLKLLATQTPLASDLRLITSAMKINSDLERIGDQAVNIAENVVKILPHPPLKPLIDIPRMAEIAEKMTRDALDSFVRKDPVLARDVLRRDDEVDQLKDQVFRELLTYMMADPGTIQRALSLILISRNIERIADHATNIAEQAVRILAHPPLKPIIDLPRMAEIAERMTRESLDAFVRKDARLARSILARDDEVDQLKDQAFRVLLTYMMADPGTIERALGLILIRRHLERIADHATNIAEDVIFLVEAKDVRHGHQEVEDR